MTFTLVVRPNAAQEAIEAYLWMESRKAGHGEEFLKALDTTFAFILSNPQGYQLRRKRFRHVMVEHFSYRVVYAVIGTAVNIYQVRHTSRRPSMRFGP